MILPVFIDLKTRFHGDFPATDRTKPLLLPEQLRQYLPALQTVSHFLCFTLFKVFPVIRIKRIGTVQNLCEADDIYFSTVDNYNKQKYNMFIREEKKYGLRKNDT